MDGTEPKWRATFHLNEHLYEFIRERRRTIAMMSEANKSSARTILRQVVVVS